MPSPKLSLAFFQKKSPAFKDIDRSLESAPKNREPLYPLESTLPLVRVPSLPPPALISNWGYHYECSIKRRHIYSEQSLLRVAPELTSDTIITITQGKQTYPPYRSIPPNPKQKAKMYEWQEDAVEKMYNKIVLKRDWADLLEAPVGTGKMYMMARLFRVLVDINFFADSISPYPALIVTKAAVVEQNERVLVNMFGLDPYTEVAVTNYEQLRAKMGKELVQEKTIIKEGEPEIQWTWTPGMHPKGINWDECQGLKNESSQQHKIGLAYSRIRKPKTFQVFSSATPFTRVIEAKYWVVGCNIQRRLS